MDGGTRLGGFERQLCLTTTRCKGRKRSTGVGRPCVTRCQHHESLVPFVARRTVLTIEFSGWERICLLLQTRCKHAGIGTHTGSLRVETGEIRSNQRTIHASTQVPTPTVQLGPNEDQPSPFFRPNALRLFSPLAPNSDSLAASKTHGSASRAGLASERAIAMNEDRAMRLHSFSCLTQG